VLTHARALLTSGPHGVTSYLDADVRDTGRVLTAAAGMLDFSRPVAVMLMAILQHVDNADNPYGIVATLLDALPPGSHLALSHPAADIEAKAQGKLAGASRLIRSRVRSSLTHRCGRGPRTSARRSRS
jgi:hypothetical protein